MRRNATGLCIAIVAIASVGSSARAQQVLTACCLPDQSCVDATAQAACQAAGGMAFGGCSNCSDVAVGCPPGACIGASGSCGLPHGTPGCDSVECCTHVCHFDPSCCTGPWPAACATLAGSVCLTSAVLVSGCLPNGQCQVFGDQTQFHNAGAGATFGGACGPDTDGNGIDDACECPPPPVPPTLRVGKNAIDPPRLDLQYDVASCNAPQHILAYGRIGSFEEIVTAECGISNTGTHTTDPLSISCWFVIARRDGVRCSGFGQTSDGERVLFGLPAACPGLTSFPGGPCP